ncbi:MAG: tetratricopeptide repeat protein, partial [Verrucomicrobiota bacterium]
MSRYRWMLPLLVGALAAQAAEPPISPKVIERYRQMLERSPVEGTALDRLWKAYSDSGETAQLLAQYQADGATRFAPQMVFGYFLRKAARLDDAVAAFEHASKLDGKSPLPWLAQARVRLDQGRPGDAAACFGKSIALLAPNDPQRLEILMQLGAAWLAAGELARASEAWERTMELDPSNVELRRRLAESYVRNQLPDRALPHFEYLRKNAAPAGRAAALQEIARLHQGAGRQEEAIAALEEALAGTAPGNWLRSELQLQLIRLHQRYRRVPELEERWKKMARENPRDAGAYLRLNELYERLGELESERGWLEKLVVLAPGNSDYRIRLARLLVSMDDLAAAATLYDALLKEQPANAQLVFERARIDLLQGRLPTARDRITGLMKAHPSDELLREKALEFFSENRLDDLVEQQLKANAASDAEEPMLALARFYSARKRDAEARHVLEQFAARNEPVEADPAKRAAARARVAQVFKDQNDPKRAARELDEAIALQPESREYRLLMGDILSMTGERGKAREAFEHAYTLSRTAAEKREADQKLFEAVLGPVAPPQAITGRPETIRMRMAASTPQRVREVEDYLLALTRAATAVPSVEAWLRVARWQMWNRSARLAQECAERALLLDPDSIEAHEFMIKLAGNDSQTPLALRHLAELMRIHPAGRLEYERRIALLHLQSGAVEEALDALSRIVAANPGSMEALIDLA